MPETHRPYPLFVPPDGLSEGVPWEWSPDQATAYAEWLQGSLRRRTEALLEYYSIDPKAEPARVFGRLVGHATASLVTEPFSVGAKLTDSGYALAADVGLLMARALLEQHPHLEWTVVRRPKSDASYNQPVLQGFGHVHFDPVGVAVAQAWGVLRGTRDGGRWPELLELWSGMAAEHSP